MLVSIAVISFTTSLHASIKYCANKWTAYISALDPTICAPIEIRSLRLYYINSLYIY